MKTCLSLMIAAGMMISSGMYSQNAADPAGCVVYSLPSTVINLEVDATVEQFYAGPYAKYAEKYLGMDVRQEDQMVCNITDVKVSTSVEADMSSRYTLEVPNGNFDVSFLKLSASGLVSFGNIADNEEVVWRFPMKQRADFSSNGVSSNLTSESAVLYKNNKKNKIGVQQNVIVAKSLEQKAEEAAEMILDLRKKRLQIVVGDTDATYSGEALGAAVAELTRLEEEYMLLFTGYSQYQQQKLTYEIVPDQKLELQRYIAFRVSDSDGLVTSDNLSGKPVVLELVPQEIADVEAPVVKEDKKMKPVFCNYRIPAICKVRISDGVKVLYQGRVPVYQLGKESSLPVTVILK